MLGVDKTLGVTLPQAGYVSLEICTRVNLTVIFISLRKFTSFFLFQRFQILTCFPLVSMVIELLYFFMIFHHLKVAKIPRESSLSGTTICSLYYKPIMIINDNSIIVNKLEISLIDDVRVVIFDRHMYTEQETGVSNSVINYANTAVNYAFREQ